MAKQWVKTAPKSLILAYENRKIGNGRAILERLLCDERMRTAWTQLAHHSRTDKQWLRVWSVIAYAKKKSNEASRAHKRRSDERDEYRQLSKKFSELATKIENGPLDVLAYELLSQDTLGALHLENLYHMDTQQRVEVAHKILPSWPSASELLRGLEKHAQELAGDAMKKPRADERSSGDIAARTFIWRLGHDFKSIFGNAMLGTLGKIADVIFDSKEDFSRSFAQNAMKGV